MGYSLFRFRLTRTYLNIYYIIQHYSTDVHLNTKQAAEASAFTQYLRDKLYPAYQYAWWVDEKNYGDVTRPTYARALRIPFNFYYPSRYQNSAKEMIDALYGEHTDLREIEKTVSKLIKAITVTTIEQSVSYKLYTSVPPIK